MTKPQIIAMNYQARNVPIVDTVYDTMGNKNYLYSESVMFPKFFVRETHVLDTQELEKSRIEKLKEWYSKDEKVEEILNVFSVPEDVIEKYKK